MPLPTPTKRQAPKTTSFDQGSHHELRASLPMGRQAIPQIPPENAQAKPTIEPQKHDHDRSRNCQPATPRPPPSHPFSHKHNVKQQTTADRRRKSPKTHHRVLVTLRARRRGADNQKSGAEPARARRSGQIVVSRQRGRPTFPAVRPSRNM